ncbi:MAG: YfhO family protein [Mollicutes bacterium]|nr:YfhO family protein [Mollicutes bacterium]
MKKRNIKYLLLAFFIPFFICLLVSYCKSFFFGGHRNLLVSDLQGQYVSLFAYFQDVLNGKESFLYSFTKGLGGNMIGTFAYYLASPFNLLLFFFSKPHLTWGILLIVILKISLSGFTMYLYLKNHYHKDSLILLIFSTAYALMAYNVNYYFNVLWLDAVYYAPLMLLGIDYIIKNKRSLLYGIILSLAILSNYYIGYMLCIFACLYFLYQLILNYKDKNDIVCSIVSFGIISLLAGLITSFLLIPTILELQNTNRAFGILTNDNFNINFNIFKILSRTYIGAHNNNNILNITTPNIYCNIIMLPLIFFYFLNEKIEKKEKKLSGIMLLIFVLSIMIPYLNMIWHGFNFPNGFNYRFSFLFILFIIFIADRSFIDIKFISLIPYFFFFIIYCLISLVVILSKYSYLNLVMVYVSVACLGLYLILLYNYSNINNKRQVNLLKYLLVILVCAELFFNFFLSIRDFKVAYQNEFNGYTTIIQKEIDKYKPHDNEFYRMEKTFNYTNMDSMLLNYKSVSTFLSTLNAKMINFFNNIGGTTHDISIIYWDNNTPLIDSLFGIKYYYSRSGDRFTYYLVDQFTFSRFTGLIYGMKLGDIYIYENSNALSLGYMVNSKVKDFTNIFINNEKYTSFEFQNLMLQTMVDSNDNYFKPYNVEQINQYNYIVDIKDAEYLYIIIPFQAGNIPKPNLDIYINEKLVNTYTLVNFGVFTLKNEYPNQTVKMTLRPNYASIKPFLPSVYYLDEIKLNEAINQLKENQLIIEKYNKNYIKGRIVATKEKNVLFTSIPYEKGWTIKVDGQKVDYYKVFDAFIGLDLSEGEHLIEFTFLPPGLKLGIIVSLVSLLIFGIYIWKEKQIREFITNLYFKYEEIINYLIVGCLTTLVNFIIYVICTKLIGIDYLISSALAWIGAVTFAYIANKWFVFKCKREDKKSLIKEIYQFIKYRIISLSIDLGLMFIIVDLIKLNDLLAKIIVQIIVIIVNYVFNKLFVFKTSKES